MISECRKLTQKELVPLCREADPQGIVQTTEFWLYRQVVYTQNRISTENEIYWDFEIWTGPPISIKKKKTWRRDPRKDQVRESWENLLSLRFQKDELISDVLLWTPTHGRAKAGRPARTYIQQLCEDTGCCPEDLPEAMNDRDKWRERVRDIPATSMTWWWWWWVLAWKSTKRKKLIICELFGLMFSFRVQLLSKLHPFIGIW